MHVDFGKWNGAEMNLAYSFRFTLTPTPVQKENRIESAVNPAHREGFDNISLLTPQTYVANARASIRCSFEGLGCPEIILVESPETCSDGAVRYGSCFEVVLYKNGINVWRHYMDKNHKCSWHKRVGVEFPVSESEIHDLSVEVTPNYLTFVVDGKKTTLRVDDLFERFYFGITMCEGIASVYEFSAEQYGA